MLIDLPTTSTAEIKAWCERHRVSKLNADGTETPCKYVADPDEPDGIQRYDRTHLMLVNPSGEIQQMDWATAITSCPTEEVTER